MKRKLISIDEEKCNGCGLCIEACHENALQLVDGKARLISESYCDGLGDCLPECPTGAITIEEREAKAYDEAEVSKRINGSREEKEPLACGCPGTASRTIERVEHNTDLSSVSGKIQSELRQWPVQIKLVPVEAPYFSNARLLVAADCTAFAYADMHRDFIKDRVVVIGCPKLDMVDYSEKLTAILSKNNIQSVTVIKMEVPCCGGIAQAVKKALKDSGKMIPWSVLTVTTDGRIIQT